MVEDSKEDKKKESKTPLLSANLSYPTRPYVAQMPALIRLIGHYTDSGRSMPQAGSPEAETAFRSHQEDEQEQQLVYNQDTQPIEVINPFVRWHRRWYRSKGVDPSPTVGVYYTPFNMALEPWAMGIGDHGCGKIFKQYRMCTHMMPSSHRYLCQDEKDDVRECMLAEKRILRHQFMYQHRVKKNLPFPEDPLIDGYNWPSFKYLN
ncbi:unnamed protein product [Adineta steineri]|uniref:Uncharacterized protein n=2 Tax=Adineta steineri TaxID=433720 RepID=A0A815QCK4_9BILA|nr:unnamed protein product [Adineta steineri]CAF0804268.1 unnamed protein product [Adineta steineri]CAF1460603.1 unnamed protein product [Adineta steineri]CAF3870477.1 unnamed protein product [Adineta steineri]CAF3938477.1 unnamed protein product [Adineta steineri]